MQSIRDLARELAEEHFKIESGLTMVAVYSHDGDSAVRLLEVNTDTVATGRVQPFLFAASDEYPLPVYIADITPEEWASVERKTISLPRGWPADPLQVFRRSDFERAA